MTLMNNAMQGISILFQAYDCKYPVVTRFVQTPKSDEPPAKSPVQNGSESDTSSAEDGYSYVAALFAAESDEAPVHPKLDA